MSPRTEHGSIVQGMGRRKEPREGEGRKRRRN